MLLGVHIIARNEADVIGRCLDSVKAFADEILVVDTGSADQTVDIARKYGARVIHAAWEDDFAKARNIALDHARTIWVLALDADEWLVAASEAGGRLRNELRGAESRAMRLRMEHELDGTGWYTLESEAVRLFRADRGYFYTGAIHEQLVWRKRSGELADIDGPPSASGLLIRHDGYRPAVMDKKNKAARNLRIIEGQLASRPDDPFCLYNFGVSLCQLGQVEAAVKAFGKSIDLTALHAPYRSTLVKDYAQTLLQLQRAEEAASLLSRELERYGGYPDLHMLYGDAMKAQGMSVRAIFAYEEAIRAGAIAHAFIAEAGASSWLSCCKAADTLLLLEQIDEAKAAYEQTLSLRPCWEAALCGLACTLQLQGMTDERIQERLTELAAESPQPNRLVARCLLHIGAAEAALPLWRKLLEGRHDGDRVTLQEAIAVAQLMGSCGRYDEAEALLLTVLEQGDQEGHQDDWLNMSICLTLYTWQRGGSIAEAAWQARAEKRWSQSGMATPEEVEALFALAGKEHFMDKKLWADNHFFAMHKWLEKAAGLGLTQLAKRLAGGHEMLELYVEELLYDEGYCSAAADLMLNRYAKDGVLSAAHSLRLGELLYDKGLYAEALALYEQALERESREGGEPGNGGEQRNRKPDIDRLRLGAAAACLQVALQGLKSAPTIRAASPNWDGGWAEPDANRLEKALVELNGLGWKTSWNGTQRRRRNGAGV